jgi:hypothetical protein
VTARKYPPPYATPTGAILDRNGIPIPASSGESPVGVAYGGGYFLAVTNDCQAVRIASSGQVADTTPIALASGSSSPCRAHSVSFDGTNFVVATDDSLGSVYATRVSPQGAVLDPSRIVISTSLD